jgi:hypothetical protein
LRFPLTAETGPRARQRAPPREPPREPPRVLPRAPLCALPPLPLSCEAYCAAALATAETDFGRKSASWLAVGGSPSNDVSSSHSSEMSASSADVLVEPRTCCSAAYLK